MFKPLEKHNIAIVCYSYGIETSPFLKSICSYCYDRGYGVTDVYIDSLGRSNLMSQKGIRIVKLNDPTIHLLNKYFFVDKKVLFLFLLRVFLTAKHYNYVFAVDYQSLHFINRIKYPLDKVIFLSMEGTDYMRLFPSADVKKVMSGCHSLYIASKERAQEINEYLSLQLIFNYFPISLRPESQIPKPSSSSLKIIFSGYFAEFSVLEELIDLFISSSLHYPSLLYLQGHYYWHEEYYACIKKKIKHQRKICIDTSFYSDDQHHELLSEFDIGIAFYKNISGTDNFENLIFSSGKIAAYLWAGLAVMTNIDCDLTRKPPFLLVESLTMESYIDGIERYREKKEEFRRTAYQLAQTKYNFDVYMDEIFEKSLFRAQ